MNTARQLLWLPTTREEKYKAKQAIDTFFVRGGDVLSAVVVYVGAGVLHLTVQQFALANVVLTLAWLLTALLILEPHKRAAAVSMRPLAGAAAAVLLLRRPRRPPRRAPARNCSPRSRPRRPASCSRTRRTRSSAGC